MLKSTTDNNCGNFQVPDEHCENLLSIGNQNVKHLCEQNPDLLIFPQSLGKYHDDIEKSHIFSLHDNNLTTCNIMGFVGRNETQLTISSRFAQNDEHDYFLHYMLQKVFSINLFKFDQTPNKENIWDFLLYLFPYYLKKAYSQGLYKAYKREDYNDANVKGTIDVKRHIRINIPFCGKIAYTTREHSHDNAVTQLIRHTIEHIKTHPYGSGVLTSDSETRDIVSKFCFITQNSYNKNARQKIISANLKPVSHPYFTEYKMLQKICLRILQREKLTFGAENDKICGLLFDGAWLWEEYLNTILKNDFIHPENKTGKHRKYLFENFQAIYPDFISKHEPIMVGDAKYMPLGNQKEYAESSERATSIYYKTITYMYRFKSDYGFLLFPHPETSFDETYTIKETNGILRKLGLAIPQNAENFTDFQNKMRINEQLLQFEKT
ncbi:MAG: McrC family protein [Lentimicrobiaceae bacterium]|nr:McrC family protein [Lentimicrobiaceae bacterium]